jgi:hypothetical protein
MQEISSRRGAPAAAASSSGMIISIIIVGLYDWELHDLRLIRTHESLLYHSRFLMGWGTMG